MPRPVRAVQVVAGLAVGALAFGAAQPASAAPTVGVEAHRGGPALGAPAGSAELFRRAVAAGVDRVELDVFFTKDEVAVINHSDTIVDAPAFTTAGGVQVPARNCSHDGLAIHTATFDQVRQVRCGGQPLPTLDEAMEILKDSGTTMNLEVKAWSATQSAASKRDSARRAVTQAVNAGMTDQMVVSTFSWRELASTIRSVSPDVYLIGFLPVRYVRQPSAAMYQQARDARAAGVDALGFDVNYAQVKHLEFIRALGMGLHLYALSSTAKIRFAVTNGAEYVSNDDPAAVRGVLEALANDPPAPSYVRTLLRRTKTVHDKALGRWGRAYPRIIGASGVVPASAQARLQSIRVRVTIRAGKSAGHLELAPSNSRLGRDGVRIPITKGTSSHTAYVSPGDFGRLRLRATGAISRVTVKVVGYTNVS